MLETVLLDCDEMIRWNVDGMKRLCGDATDIYTQEYPSNVLKGIRKEYVGSRKAPLVSCSCRCYGGIGAHLDRIAIHREQIRRRSGVSRKLDFESSTARPASHVTRTSTGRAHSVISRFGERHYETQDSYKPVESNILVEVNGLRNSPKSARGWPRCPRRMAVNTGDSDSLKRR